MNPTQVILAIWLGLILVTLITGGFVMVWALRNHQFSDQDRARYLPLGYMPGEYGGQPDDSRNNHHGEGDGN